MWGHSLSQEKSFFIYHHTGCFWSLRQYSPTAWLLTDAMWPHCRNKFAKNSALYGARDAALRFFRYFLWILLKSARPVLKIREWSWFHSLMVVVLFGRDWWLSCSRNLPFLIPGTQEPGTCFGHLLVIINLLYISTILTHLLAFLHTYNQGLVKYPLALYILPTQHHLSNT